MTPERAEPVTVTHPQSHPGRGERRGDEASIFTAKECGRCLEPERSLRKHGDGVREEGTPSRRWGEGTPRADGSTRDTVGHRAPAQPSLHGAEPEAGSLRCAAQPAACGRVFWMSGTDAVGRTLPRKHPSRVAPVSG